MVDVFEELKRKHEDFNTTKLCLWARMIMRVLMTHPTCQGFQAYTSHERRVTILQKHQLACTLNAGLSPFRLADVRIKHYEQLRYLQTLFDDGILNDAELSEQKSTIFDALCM